MPNEHNIVLIVVIDAGFISCWFLLYHPLHQLVVHLDLFLEGPTGVPEGDQIRTCRTLMSGVPQQGVQPSRPVAQDSRHLRNSRDLSCGAVNALKMYVGQ
jgi:hypothetical protein